MDELKKLAGESLIVQRNSYLKVEGSIDTNIYYVEQGSLRVFVVDDSNEHIIRFGYKGDLLVSLDSFISEKPSEFFIQAIKKSELKVISKKVFKEFVNQSEGYLQWWISVLEGLILQQIEREKDLLITSPKDRYQRVLKRSPRLFQEVPERYIAAYLRMSPETLSRLKKS